MSKLQMIITGDGSHSLLNTALDETYHSRHGALQESIYVFISKGLEHWLRQTGSTSASILEIGFGTGLNALLTAQYSRDHSVKIEYSTLEAFPVEENIWTQLNYTDSPESKDLFKKLHEAEWNKQQDISSDNIVCCVCKRFYFADVHISSEFQPSTNFFFI